MLLTIAGEDTNRWLPKANLSDTTRDSHICSKEELKSYKLKIKLKCKLDTQHYQKYV